MYEDLKIIPYKAPKYKCDIHGLIERNIITSTIIGHEGIWCQKCYLEILDKSGVKRAIVIEDNK